MEGNNNNYNGNHNLGNGMDNMQSSHMENEIKNTSENSFTASTENTSAETASSSTGAQGSIYSYSYVNQENQERNPNYYERKEEDNINAQRGYTAGTYENAPGSNHMGSQENAHGSNAMGGWQNAAGSNDAAGNAGQGAFQGQGAAAKRDKFYKKEKKQKTPGTKKQHGFGMTVVKCASLALVFGLVSSTVFYGTGFAFRKTMGVDKVTQEATEETAGKSSDKTGGSLSATNVSTATTVTDVSDIAENVMPSIVSITNISRWTFLEELTRRIPRVQAAELSWGRQMRKFI